MLTDVSRLPADRGGVDERRRAGDGHVLGKGADTELQIERDGLRRTEIELPLLVLEPVDVGRDLVVPRRERRRDVGARRIGHNVAILIGRGVVDRDRHARHDCGLRVGDDALKCRSEKRPRRRGGQEPDRNGCRGNESESLHEHPPCFS